MLPTASGDEPCGRVKDTGSDGGGSVKAGCGEAAPNRAHREGAVALVSGTFDFGLTAAQEERAARLMAESVVIDLLFQGPVGYRSFTPAMEAEVEAFWTRTHDLGGTLTFARALPVRKALVGESPDFQTCWEGSGITAGNRQFVLDSPAAMAASFALHTAQFDRLPWLRKALCAEDLRRAKREGARVGFLTTQDTTGIARDVGILDVLHDYGVRLMGLTYNSQNYVGSGCTDRSDGGLTDFGLAFVRRMNELRMVVDTAHSGRRTTLDCCALSRAPVVATHTAARGVYAHDRGKSDEELRAIAATGGVIGVLAVPFFLAPGEGVTIAAMLDHIDYIATLVGWRHVAIGTDWPLQLTKSALRRLDEHSRAIGFRPEHGIDSVVNLVGFDDYRDFPNIARGLVARGYSDEQVAGILGGNALRVFGEVWGG